MMKYLSQTEVEVFRGKRVLVRLDLNIPIPEDGMIKEEDADRIKASMDTINFLKNAGAKILVISHIGRDPKETLQPIADYMQIPMVKTFDAGLWDTQALIMLENLRSNPGEEANDPLFAEQLASYADLFVNDAFAVSHRAHASIVGVPKLLVSYAGFQMEREIENLSKAFHPESPSILILGGAKFETKLPVIQKFISIVDHIIVGGALANNFYKEMGYEIGASLIDSAANIKDLVHHPKILVPETVVVENVNGQETKAITAIVTGDKIVDAAPEGLAPFAEIFASSRFILWNGPLGNYENGFTSGSKKAIDLITTSEGFSIVGGGDSVALVEKLGQAKDFGFLSTGGGAMLEYLANETLPGIDALEKSA